MDTRTVPRACLAGAALVLGLTACGPQGDGVNGPVAQRMLILAADPLAEAADEYATFRQEGGFEVE
ncbi:MAG TPA: hypothetical protein P5076_20710, partial [Myxococcota bacterium]|nr:hypothetical protein [Myxococcota bacterium]